MAFNLWTAEPTRTCLELLVCHQAGIAHVRSLGRCDVLATCRIALWQAHGHVAPFWDAALQVANPACVFMDEPTSGGDLMAALLLTASHCTAAEGLLTKPPIRDMQAAGLCSHAAASCTLFK